MIQWHIIELHKGEGVRERLQHITPEQKAEMKIEVTKAVLETEILAGNVIRGWATYDDGEFYCGTWVEEMGLPTAVMLWLGDKVPEIVRIAKRTKGVVVKHLHKRYCCQCGKERR